MIAITSSQTGHMQRLYRNRSPSHSKTSSRGLYRAHWAQLRHAQASARVHTYSTATQPVLHRYSVNELVNTVNRPTAGVANLCVRVLRVPPLRGCQVRATDATGYHAAQCKLRV
jgi:hypothetical protein